MTKPDVRACPFCGGVAEINYMPGWEPGTADKSMASIHCRACLASMSWKPTAKVIATWNRRVPFDDQDPAQCSCRNGWVDDECWEPDYPDLPQERVPHNGLIRCGFCNIEGDMSRWRHANKEASHG